MTRCITSLHTLVLPAIVLKLIDNSLHKVTVLSPRKASFQCRVSSPSTGDGWEIWIISYFNTFIDLTPVFSCVSLTFARRWLILAIWGLVRPGAVYKLNLGLRLTDYLFTVFIQGVDYSMGCVCVYAQTGLYMSESTGIVSDGSSGLFVGLQVRKRKAWNSLSPSSHDHTHTTSTSQYHNPHYMHRG